jgi:tetratricopeptide (TPR) repeat protein
MTDTNGAHGTEDTEDTENTEDMSDEEAARKKDEMERLMGEPAPDEVVQARARKDHDVVLAWCDAALAEDPERCVALIYKAEILDARGDYEGAFDLYSSVVMRAPFVHFAWEYIAMHYIKRRRDRESARRALFSCVKSFPASAWSWCLLALTYYLDEEYELMKLAFEAGEVQAQEKSTVMHIKGFIHEYRGETDDAVLAYTASQAYAKKEDQTDEDLATTREALHRLLTEGLT